MNTRGQGKKLFSGPKMKTPENHHIIKSFNLFWVENAQKSGKKPRKRTWSELDLFLLFVEEMEFGHVVVVV